MSDLFELAMPWWEFLLRASVVYVVLLVLVRLSGKRSVGQYTPFDLILIALLGNAVQNSLLGKDTSLLGGLLLVSTLVGLNWMVDVLSARSRRIERFLVGEPTLLARNGHVYERVLRRSNVSKADFEEAMREHEIMDVAEIGVAVLETNGTISIIRRDGGESTKPPRKRSAV